MAFTSFLGRALFVSAFLLSSWHEFNNGGSAARTLRPKFDVFSQHVLSHTGVKLPAVEIKYLVATSIALKGLGSLFFICGSSYGAFLLFMHQAIFIPLLYDFYNYDSDKKQFSRLFSKFTLNMQLVGALLFFIGMNNKIIMRQTRKKTTKTKTM